MFADLHVRKRATFADLHSYTHAYCSFVLLNEAITIVLGSHCLHVIWLFGILHTIYREKIYSELNIVLLNVTPIPVCPQIKWHMGNLYLANKELIVPYGMNEWTFLNKIYANGKYTELQKEFDINRLH